MDANTFNYSFSIADFIRSIISSTNRTFCKIGYLRAASELKRSGYIEEANRCIRLMKSL